MRIIAGKFRGTRLQGPDDRSIRPTGDRTREALFNILAHGDAAPEGARFLDLFCGSGMVGLEACSRGAAEVWLIDRDTSLAAKNVRALGRPDHVHLRRADATALPDPPARFDLVFLDPPYNSGLADTVLRSLLAGWLADGASIIVELAAKEMLSVPDGLSLNQERRYGAARLVFLGYHGRHAPGSG